MIGGRRDGRHADDITARFYDDPEDDEMNTYEITGRVVRTTERAALIDIDEHGEEWIPFSQMEVYDPDMERDDEVTVTITEWIAQQKGLDL